MHAGGLVASLLTSMRTVAERKPTLLERARSLTVSDSRTQHAIFVACSFDHFLWVNCTLRSLWTLCAPLCVAAAVSWRDAAQVFGKCVDVADDVPFLVVAGISMHDQSHQDLQHTIDSIGYMPLDGYTKAKL